MTRPTLCITAGEPAGIGPDLCLMLAARQFDANGIEVALIKSQRPRTLRKNNNGYSFFQALKAAFTGRSSNNAGFLAAILHAEGLLSRATDSETKHVCTGDWASWKVSLLATALFSRIES